MGTARCRARLLMVSAAPMSIMASNAALIAVVILFAPSLISWTCVL
jgi:hypothetical protein